MTAPAPPAPTERVLQLLAGGMTAQRVADLTGWPRGRVIALINGRKGWLLDPQLDTVYEPGRRGQAPTTVEFDEPARVPRAQQAADPVSVPIDRIEPNPRNVRDGLGDLTELAASITLHGILQPLVAYHRGGDIYQLLIGHRRHAAAQMAGLTEVPVIVRAPVDADTAIEIMLIENCHRQGLSPMEKAEAFGKLRDLGHNQPQIAQRTGFAQSTVSYFLALLDLDEASKERIRAGELTASDAVAAIRKTRRAQRKRHGSPADYSWEPDFLSESHPLARRAKRLCEAREHTMRRRIGKTACGQCWETAIRADERTVIQAQAAPS